MSSDQTAARDEEMALAEKLPQADASSLVDREVLEGQVQEMYRQVARGEDAQLHFAVGRGLAPRVGYPSELLDAVPEEALASFAGVGYHLDLAELSSISRTSRSRRQFACGTGTASPRSSSSRRASTLCRSMMRPSTS